MADVKKPPNTGMLPKGKITEQSVRENMHLTPQQAQQLDRIVLAGKKVMFSEKSHRRMLEQLQGPGTIDVKLGQGIAGLMGLLMQESKGSLPHNLLIPAGMILLVVAAEFLRQMGTEVTDQDIGTAIHAMTTAMLHAAGVDPNKVAAAGERGAGGGKAMQGVPA